MHRSDASLRGQKLFGEKNTAIAAIPVLEGPGTGGAEPPESYALFCLTMAALLFQLIYGINVEGPGGPSSIPRSTFSAGSGVVRADQYYC